VAVERAIVELVTQGVPQFEATNEKVQVDLTSTERAGKRAEEASSRAEDAAKKASTATEDLARRASSAIAGLQRAASLIQRGASVAGDLGFEVPEELGVITGGVSTAAQFAAQGARFGPVGAAVGGAIGLAVGGAQIYGGFEKLEQERLHARQVAEEVLKQYDQRHSSDLNEVARARAELARLGQIISGGRP